MQWSKHARKRYRNMSDSSHIEKIFTLSTAHMPYPEPMFKKARWVAHEFGYIVWVMSLVPDSIENDAPEWLRPIWERAYKEGCTLILFDRDASVVEDLEAWEW